MVSVKAKGERQRTILYAVLTTSMGPVLFGSSARGICYLGFTDDTADLQQHYPEAELYEATGQLRDQAEMIRKAVEKPGDDLSHIPLDVCGTPFQHAVWDALVAIPAGETRSYAEIAQAIGRPKAVRAVGSANGANPVPILVPCHRVVRSDGSLGGFAWGLDAKRELLAREER